MLASNLERYLQEVCRVDVNKDQLYYVIPMLGCDNCINNHLHMLKNQISTTVNVTVIFSGKIVKKSWLADVEAIKTKYNNVILDKDDRASIYDFGLLKPVVAEKKNNQWIYYNLVKDAGMQQLVAYMNQR